MIFSASTSFSTRGRVLRDGSGINSGLGLIAASGRSLDDPRKRAAIAGAMKRYQRAGDWPVANPDAYAQIYATFTRLAAA